MSKARKTKWIDRVKDFFLHHIFMSLFWIIFMKRGTKKWVDRRREKKKHIYKWLNGPKNLKPKTENGEPILRIIGIGFKSNQVKHIIQRAKLITVKRTIFSRIICQTYSWLISI